MEDLPSVHEQRLRERMGARLPQINLIRTLTARIGPQANIHVPIVRAISLNKAPGKGPDLVIFGKRWNLEFPATT